MYGKKTVNYTQSMSDSVYLCQSVSLFPPSQLVPSSSSHSPLMSSSVSLPFHISSSISSTVLGIRQCHAVMIHIDWITHLYFLFCKLTWTHEEVIQFSPQMVWMVLRILNMCVLVLCVVSVVWSVQFMTLFMVLSPLMPNNPYSGHTAPLTSKVAVYIFIQQI